MNDVHRFADRMSLPSILFTSICSPTFITLINGPSSAVTVS